MAANGIGKLAQKLPFKPIQSAAFRAACFDGDLVVKRVDVRAGMRPRGHVHIDYAVTAARLAHTSPTTTRTRSFSTCNIIGDGSNFAGTIALPTVSVSSV